MPIRMYIVQYKCGCSDGPLPKCKILNYCAKHGADVKMMYPILIRKKKQAVGKD